MNFRGFFGISEEFLGNFGEFELKNLPQPGIDSLLDTLHSEADWSPVNTLPLCRNSGNTPFNNDLDRIDHSASNSANPPAPVMVNFQHQIKKKRRR